MRAPVLVMPLARRFAALASRALDPEIGRLTLWLPVFIGAGVLFYFALKVEPWVWTGAATLAVLAPTLALSWRFDPARALLLPPLCLALGFTAAQYAAARAPALVVELPSAAVLVTGVVTEVEILPEGRRVTFDRVTLDPGDTRLHRLARVRLRASDTTSITTGDTLRVRAMIRPIGGPTHPGGWDMRREAYFAGLGASGYALAPVEPLRQAAPTGLLGVPRVWAERAAARVRDAIPGPAGAIAVGILIGSQTGIAPADMAAFRDSGLAHILSVSGLHLAIVIGMTTMLARWALALSEHASLFWPTRAIASVFALGVGGFYTLFTGAQVPTVRCFLMACLITLGILTGRRVISLRTLGLAAAFILLTAPWRVLGASMQMSFAAVLALIAGFEAFRPRQPTSWRDRVALFVGGLIMSSALAGTATLPFGAYHFGRVQIYYIVSNLIGVPLTTALVMPAGMLALPLIPFGWEGPPLLIVQWGIEATLWLAHVVAAWPSASLDVPHLADWGIALITLGMIGVALGRGWPRLWGVAPILAGLLSPVFDRPPDILVSHDARQIGVRVADAVYLRQTQGGSAFQRESWLRYWGTRRVEKLPMTGEAADGAIRCGPTGCLLRPRQDAPAAWLVRAPERVGNCAGIAVIVAAEPARGLCDRPWPALVDRFTVWRDGATAIWLEPAGATVLTERAASGARPWVPPPPTPRARADRRPPATPNPEPREFWQNDPLAE
jgi:competence protein ComEC